MRRSGKKTAGLLRPGRGVVAALVAAGVLLPSALPAAAAPSPASRIDSFGPYRLGMSLDQAKAAHKGGRPGDCGDIAPERRCVILDAAVFEEPGVIYAVLDAAGGRIERIVASLDPQRTQRRAYRCVRLAEKVFALLVVVYGSEYKQSHDQNRRPLPAVAWDGESSGRVIFEARCRTADAGNPRISVVEHYPDGAPPPVAAANEPKTAAPRPATALQRTPEAPAPAAAPVGPVEVIRPDVAATVAPDNDMAALVRELAQAKGRMMPAREAAPARPVDAAVAARRADPDELPEPPDLIAPEPFMVPEEEERFRERRETAAQPATGTAARAAAVASAPIALLSTTTPTRKIEPQAAPQPAEPAAMPPTVSRTAAKAEVRIFKPVYTGGWRHRAPVPPARPWRERPDAAG